MKRVETEPEAVNRRTFGLLLLAKIARLGSGHTAIFVKRTDLALR
jgi:hypothetical protein